MIRLVHNILPAIEGSSAFSFPFAFRYKLKGAIVLWLLARSGNAVLRAAVCVAVFRIPQPIDHSLISPESRVRPASERRAKSEYN